MAVFVFEVEMSVVRLQVPTFARVEFNLESHFLYLASNLSHKNVFGFGIDMTDFLAINSSHPTYHNSTNIDPEIDFLFFQLSHSPSSQNPSVKKRDTKTLTPNVSNRFVLFISGLAHVTLPNTTVSPTTSAWIQGGKYGLIIAADTSGVSKYGHATAYPSDADTVALQVPFRDGKIPDHMVLYDGPCLWTEMVGV